MKTLGLVALSMLAVALPGAGVARAEPQGCRIEPFRGATSAQGAVAKIHVVNDGRPCAIANYGLPGERRHPAESGTITRQAEHGKAEFVAPHARYVPQSGFAGVDAFAYEARARGLNDQPVRLKVQVRVFVVAP